MARCGPGSEVASLLLGSARISLNPTISTRWTTSIRWTSTGPVKQQIQVGSSSPARASYTGPVDRAKLEAIRLRNNRLNQQQPLPSAPPAPPTAPPTVDSNLSLPHILNPVRATHRHNETLNPSTILDPLRPQLATPHQSGYSYLPTPPPPITLPTPDPHPASPHALAALILQCIALGVSAWGLSLGRPRSSPPPSEDVNSLPLVTRQPELRWTETEEVFALNLLLSAYVAPQLERIPAKWGWPKVCADYGIRLRGLVSHGSGGQAVPLTLEGHLTGMAEVLKRFDPAKGLAPTRWTIATVLATANTSAASLAGQDAAQVARFEAARPLLARWAWKSYAGLRTTEGAATGKLVKGDEPIIGGLVRLLGEDGIVEADAAEEMIDRLVTFAFGTTACKPPLGLDSASSVQLASTPLLLLLGHTAMQHGQLHLVTQFFSAHSPLPPIKRAELALEFLNHLAVDEDGRRERELVCQAAEVLAQFADDALAAEETGTKADKWKFGRKLMVQAVECLMEAGLKVDVPLEGFITRIAVAVLKSSEGVPASSRPSADEYPFEMKVLRHLSYARHPVFTRRVFDAMPMDQRRVEHFSPLLRSHHQDTSRRAWLELRQHSTLRPTTDSFSARMSSHIQTADWTLAKFDLAEMRRLGVQMDRKLANKVLTLVVECGSDRELERAKRALASGAKVGELSPDTTTFTTLVGAATRTGMERAEGEGEVRCRRRAPRFGATQLRALRREVMGVSRREAGRRAHGAVDSKTGEEFPATTNEVTKNVLLRSVLRWTNETQTADIVNLVRQHLGVDLTLTPDNEGASGQGWVPNAGEWEEWRRARWKMVEKGLRNRGEKVVLGRVGEWKRFEEGLVWKMEGGIREKGWERIEEGERKRRKAVGL